MSLDDLPPTLQDDIAAVQRIPAVPSILDVVRRTTGMGFAAIARVTEGHWVACSVQDGIQFGLQPGSQLKVDATICQEIQHHHLPVIIENVAENKSYSAQAMPSLYGFQSYISMPIILPEGTFFGTLCAIDSEPRTLDTPEIVSTFKLFAELIAFHLDAHARLASLDAKLLREREIAELREQFIAVLGHDLRNPLASVSAGARLMLRHPERASELAKHIEQSVSRMAGLIDNVLDFARGRLGGGLSLIRDADKPLGPMLEQVVQESRTSHPERVIGLDIDLGEPVACDQARIAQLLSNLLGNALTHGSAAEPIRVRALAQDGTFELAVANIGEPIPASIMASLFQPFFSAGDQNRREGLGLGLYIASEIARAHGGALNVTSTPAETCFTLRMPTNLQQLEMLGAVAGSQRDDGFSPRKSRVRK